MHKSPRKLERSRGSTLLTTVLVSIVAATIGMVSIQVSLIAGTSELSRLEVNQSKLSMNTGLMKVAATLEHNPLSIYYQVLPDESDRLCYLDADNTTVIEAGSPWPADCGPVWGYNISEYASGVLIKPPSAASTLLELSAFGRAGEVAVGQKEVYSILGPAAPSLYSGTLLDTGNTGFDVNEYNGIVYSYNEAIVTDESKFANGSIVAAEKYTSPLTTEACSLRCTFALSSLESDTMLNVRNIYKAPMSPGGVDSSITVLQKIACLDPSPAIIDGHVTSLCLRPGGTLVDANSNTFIMPTAGAVLVTESESPGQLSIYSTASASTGGISAANWTLVGDFLYPSSGVLYSDYTTYVGSCFSKPQDCTNTFSKGLTVVSGSPANRKDVVVGTSLQGPGIGLVASGVVKISILSAESGISVNAAILASGRPNEPLLLTPTGQSGSGSSLSITGQLVLSRYEVDLSAYTIKTHISSVSSAPFFPGPLLKFIRISAVPLTASQASALAEGTAS